MSRPDGVMVTAFAVDTLVTMLGGGVVHRNQHGFFRRDHRKDGMGQDFPQRPQRPRGAGQDAVVRGDTGQKRQVKHGQDLQRPGGSRQDH
jgi:hypothetical protein